MNAGEVIIEAETIHIPAIMKVLHGRRNLIDKRSYKAVGTPDNMIVIVASSKELRKNTNDTEYGNNEGNQIGDKLYTNDKYGEYMPLKVERPTRINIPCIFIKKTQK